MNSPETTDDGPTDAGPTDAGEADARSAGGTGAEGWRLVLASASPARLATLRSAGVEPMVRVSAVDEQEVLVRTGVSDAEEVPLLLARVKAEDVASALSRERDNGESSRHDPETGAIVLGCDSILDLDGEVLGKPADAADAVRRWQRMRGRSGLLRTGHWLIDLRPAEFGGTRGAIGGSSVTTVHFANLADDEIAAYVATGEPLNVAGAFTIDGLGGAFVTGIDGDHHGVVGVSLPLLRDMLGRLNVRWSELWCSPGLPAP